MLMSNHILGIPLFAFVIFAARICDVSIGTLRIILLSRGMRFLPPILGFVEVLIWLSVVSQVVRNLTTPMLLIAYAGGYATGNYLGIRIEGKLRFGTVILRIITRKDASEMIKTLRDLDYGVTKVEADGAQGPVHIVFTVVKRRDLRDVIEIMRRFHPHAFYTVEDVREVHEGMFPVRRNGGLVNPIHRK